MAERIIQLIDYESEKDILFLAVEPGVESIVRRHLPGILLMYDRQNPEKLVGIEILDFAHRIIPSIESLQLPQDFSDRFTIPDSSLRNASLLAVLRWCFDAQCPKPPLYALTEQAVPVVAEGKP